MADWILIAACLLGLFAVYVGVAREPEGLYEWAAGWIGAAIWAWRRSGDG